MTGYIIRRLGQSVIVVLGVTLIVFVMLHLLPGSLARDILGSRATPQAMAQFNHQNHLDRSFVVQYWYFLKQLLHGNLGYSYQFNRSVDSLLATELPRDLVLGGLSLILSLMIAIPVGIAQAVKRNKAGDYVGTGVSFILYSMPQYAIALLLIQLLSITFHVFPAEAPQGTSALSMLEHPAGLVLPVASLTLVSFAYFSRYMRSSAIDTLAQDYIRTARAKGLPERLVLMRHLLRNSLIAVVTLVGLSIPVVITGTLIIEQVFNFPGAGLEYYQAALRNDYEVMLGITVLVGVVTVVGNLVADIGYAILDPRIRY
jgi:peptide/nickel transport system permease protein